MEIDLETLTERNCGNCYHRNEKYKILGCKLHNKQTKLENCCSSHVFDLEQEEKQEREEEGLDYPISGEMCECGKPMYDLGQRKISLGNDDGYDYYDFLCTDEGCDKKLIIKVCQHCEHEMRWYE